MQPTLQWPKKFGSKITIGNSELKQDQQYNTSCFFLYLFNLPHILEI